MLPKRRRAAREVNAPALSLGTLAGLRLVRQKGGLLPPRRKVIVELAEEAERRALSLARCRGTSVQLCDLSHFELALLSGAESSKEKERAVESTEPPRVESASFGRRKVELGCDESLHSMTFAGVWSRCEG